MVPMGQADVYGERWSFKYLGPKLLRALSSSIQCDLGIHGSSIPEPSTDTDTRRYWGPFLIAFKEEKCMKISRSHSQTVWFFKPLRIKNSTNDPFPGHAEVPGSSKHCPRMHHCSHFWSSFQKERFRNLTICIRSWALWATWTSLDVLPICRMKY